MRPPRIEAKDLVVERQGLRILDGASLAVGAGEIASIEGPSGSGKSTLLRAMATLIPIDGGRVTLEGEDAGAIAPTVFRRRVAYVPQQPPMLPGSVADNLATGPSLRGERLGGEAALALLARTDLPASFAERHARDLSGGERQRVALARALANEPVVLLLDEPTAALDPDASAHILELVRALAREGLSVVVVTHQAEHAERLGGTRWECRAGRVARREGSSP
jgi:putative ABC transport system ATP-binding protein